ncbi:MAG TPA: DegT/DnrJ/EryC1/StrS family aminotransferase, partial [Mariprofundaceae bacterium]|nr:DegT/DnrJ/EryC1/StrS family aminotransferase [Mariprofundaceae bacterium]
MDKLAIDGGKPVRSSPLPSWPHYADDEIEAARAVLASGRVNYWTGDEGRAFEQEFADYIGAPYAIAVANGTLALELALYALGIGPGDEVLVPSRTFIATASSVVRVGATPVVVDLEPDSQGMSVAAMQRALTTRTRAAIPVHLGGWPCDMDAIMAFAKEHGLKVIEDCAQSLGAEYRGRQTGSFGDMAAFSFCQDKIMTTGGEGGMLVTSDESLWRRAWAYKDHGKDYDLVYHAQHPPGHRWLHASFGSNFRMTEMQAAIGRRQLAKLPAWLERRERNARFLMAALSDVDGLYVPAVPAHVRHAFYRLYVYIDPERLRAGWNQDRVIEAI